ncbi:DUF2239 family protein [Stenotrophomonas mori]|uniref:DUF2239 family protein n=1 Tax=Stenotrophomonas mori TaxID=2871096 RepID=A0ABT0SES6_9GAMM|nr:DUF2239 family protein [Stenotrophomonas mori]MCL7713814.1 DUF2239 family protein [Stenotrophomonas mori]
MPATPLPLYSLFQGHRHVACGSPEVVALALRQLRQVSPSPPALVFDNTSGRTHDFDTRGSEAEVRARLAAPPPPEPAPGPADPPAARGRGRPRLGVVGREVTLLPRHWAWLGEQPGGASVALRRLVEAARRTQLDKDRRRRAAERAYHFLQTLAGDLPGFEEALRALFAEDHARLEALAGNWPADVRTHALRLATPDEDDASTG